MASCAVAVERRARSERTSRHRQGQGKVQLAHNYTADMARRHRVPVPR